MTAIDARTSLQCSTYDCNRAMSFYWVMLLELKIVGARDAYYYIDITALKGGYAMSRSGFARKATCVVASVALVFGLAPIPAFAAEGEDAVRTALEAGNYVEGEAIVCSVDSQGFSTQSEGGGSLLDGADELSCVTARQYAEATGDGAAGIGALSTQS